MNNHSDTVFEYYDDRLPDYERYGDEHAYFPATSFPDQECINLLITMYDEEVSELQRTLVSVAQMITKTKRRVRVLIVQDGWCKAHHSVKDYMRNMLFPSSRDLWDEVEMATQVGMQRTYIIQATDSFTGEMEEIWVSPSYRLPISVIVKTDNRMKYNSHSWFLRAFCKDYASTYLFMTDVGSEHHELCLSRLELFMDRNDGLVGCHGYPWVADAAPGASRMQLYIRAMQEYELGPLASDHDRGFQSFFGFQQTLSGPCTMLRTEDATFPSLLAFMSSVLERDPSQLNILSSNLMIVEDTAMTLYLFASSGKMLAIVPDAYYYYDVETQPARFFTQRRRWMNGVGCGLLIFWRTYHKILQRSVHTRLIQVFVRIILALGIITQVLFPFVQPMLFAYVVFQSFNPNFCSAYPHVLRGFQERALRPCEPWLATGVTTGYVLWFLVWTLYHARSSTSFNPRMFGITFALCHTVGLYSYYAIFIVTAQVSFQLIPIWQRPIVAGIIGGHYIGPVVSSVMKRDWRTLRVSTTGLIPYLTFFPMWSFIYSYNIARLWDVTWGNRSGILDVQQKVTQYKTRSQKMTYQYIVGLLLCAAAFCYTSLQYNAAYLHALYVAPWYLLSSVMSLASIGWIIRYHRYCKKMIDISRTAPQESESFDVIVGTGPSIFRFPTFKRMQRRFTFGTERSSYMP